MVLMFLNVCSFDFVYVVLMMLYGVLMPVYVVLMIHMFVYDVRMFFCFKVVLMSVYVFLSDCFLF